MDGETAAQVSLVISVLAMFIAVFAVVQAIDARKRALELAIRDVKILLEQVIAETTNQLGKATHQPELSLLLGSQWRFIEKIYRYRFEKSLISKKIASKYILPKSIVLLDSGSTTDLVTSELLLKPKMEVQIYSNNIFAAIHLIGSRHVRFFLLQGNFNERYAAVYSDEAVNRLDQHGVHVFILAAMAFNFEHGIMVHQEDSDNLHFKKKALELFQKDQQSSLVIAVDASKFCETRENLISVLSSEDWRSLCRTESKRITVVTAFPPLDLSAECQVIVKTEIRKFRDAGVTVDDETVGFGDDDDRPPFSGHSV